MNLSKNHQILAIIATMSIGLVAIMLLLGSPVSAEAEQKDPILAQMELSYNAQVLSENEAFDTYLKAQSAYMQSSLSRCESEKAIAQYKIAFGIEHERIDDLRKKTEVNCVAF